MPTSRGPAPCGGAPPAHVSPHSSRASAAAGRSRAARQPPKAPDSSPPATASATATAIAVTVTGALRWTDTVWTVLWLRLLSTPARNVPGAADAVDWPTVALRGGAILATRAAPPNPTPTPAAPPRIPMTTDSPITWATTRRLRQPRALSVPNSRTRRDTAAMVSRLASRKAAMSTATASHLPRLLARLAVLASDPETSLARSLDVVTVADGSSLLIACCTLLICAALVAA